MDHDFEKFFDLSLDMLCIAGTDGYLKRVNRAFARVLGWTDEQLLARPFTEFIHPEDVAATLEEVQRLAAGIPTISFHNRYSCADGSYRYLHWKAFPDPETGLLYAAARDVTELRRAQERFRLAIEASPAAMVMVDTRGEIAMVNEATESLFGLHRQELVGRSVDELLPERARGGHEKARRRFSAAPMARAMGQDMELTALKRDGTEFPVEVGLRPIETEDGSFVLAAIIDLSERKRAAEQLAAKTLELERSNRELEQFARVASHDLQEPLRIVAGYTQLLAQRYEGKLDEEADEFIGYAVEGVTRMQELINGLLSYARVQTRARGFEPVSVSEAVDWACANLELAIAEADAKITEEHLPTVLGDPTQLRQLFQNLLSNAIKFRGDRRPEVHVGAGMQAGRWLLSVRDNGIGIDPAQRERVFEVFQRLHSQEEYEGTGIGLAVCQRIVERHGGEIWFEPAPDGGSIFYFTLPPAREDPEDDNPPSRDGVAARTANCHAAA